MQNDTALELQLYSDCFNPIHIDSAVTIVSKLFNMLWVPIIVFEKWKISDHFRLSIANPANYPIDRLAVELHSLS